MNAGEIARTIVDIRVLLHEAETDLSERLPARAEGRILDIQGVCDEYVTVHLKEKS